MARSIVTPEAFIDAWRDSDSVDDVCKRTGMTRRAVIARAQRYRDEKVPLKRFRGGKRKLDYATLAERATEDVSE